MLALVLKIVYHFGTNYREFYFVSTYALICRTTRYDHLMSLWVCHIGGEKAHLTVSAAFHKLHPDLRFLITVHSHI